MIFGIEACAPISQEDCKVKFIRNLRFYDMPKSYHYMMKLEKSEIFDGSFSSDVDYINTELKIWKEYLAFFYNRPSIEEIDQFIYDRNYISSVHLVGMPHEFKVAVFEIKESAIDENEIFNVLCYLSHYNSFSQILFDRYLNSNPELEFDYYNSMIIRDCRLSLAIENVLHDSTDRSLKLYIRSRNSVDRFNLEDFKDLKIAHIMLEMTELLYSTSFNLSKLDMFSKCLRAQTNPLIVQHIFNLIFSHSSQFLLEIILTESPFTLNYFSYENASKITIFSVFSRPILPSKSFIETVFMKMNIYDPIFILFMSPIFLVNSKQFIKDRFNLNICYHFNLDFRPIVYSPLSNEQAIQLDNKIISFVNLLKFIGKESLLHIFTSDPTLWNHGDHQQYPLISLRHLINIF